MILVLGGTLVCAVGLLYFSLLPGAPPKPAKNRRNTAEATGTLISIADDPDAGDRSNGR
jgi:hypothetical protein